MNNYVVYEHIFPDGSIYVGMTGNTPELRWGKGMCYNERVRDLVKLYGWENVKHNIVFSGLSADEAVLQEKLLIQRYVENNEDKILNVSHNTKANRQYESIFWGSFLITEKNIFENNFKLSDIFNDYCLEFYDELKSWFVRYRFREDRVFIYSDLHCDNGDDLMKDYEIIYPKNVKTFNDLKGFLLSKPMLTLIHNSVRKAR